MPDQQPFAGPSASARWKLKRLRAEHARPSGVFVLADASTAADAPSLFHYLPRAPLLVRGSDGLPVFSLTLVLRRQPGASEESVYPLIQQGLLNFDVSLDLPAAAQAELEADAGRTYKPLFPSEVTFELGKGAEGEASHDEPLARAVGSGTSGRAAIGATLGRTETLDVLAAIDRAHSRLALRATIAYNTAGTDHVVAVHGSAAAVHDFLRERLGDRATMGRNELRRHFTDMTRLLKRSLRVQPNDATSLDLFDAFLRSALPVLRREPPPADGAAADAEPQYSLRDRPGAGTRLDYEEAVSGPERRAVSLSGPLDEIVGGALEGLEREQFIRLVCPTSDGVLAPVARVRVARQLPPSRDAKGGETRMRLMHADGSMRSVALALRPDAKATPLTHAVLASDMVATRPLVVAGGRQWWLDDVRLDVGAATAGGALESLPVVGDDSDAPVWEDRRNAGSYWYAPSFELVPPAGNESPAASPFLFNYSSGVTAAGEQLLAATLRLTLRRGASAATTARLQQLGGPPAKPVPTEGLSVALELPFRDETGASKVQAFPATVAANGDTLTVTVALIGSWVRLCYGALAFPGFQQEPARLTVAYSFRAYAAAGPVITGAVLATIHKEALTPVIAAAGHERTARDAPFFDASRGAYCFPGGELRFTAEAKGRGAGHAAASARPARAGVLARPVGVVGLGRPIVATPILAQPVTAPRLGVLEGLRRNFRRTVLRQERVDALFPCNVHGAFYVESAGATQTRIGCRDALRLGQTTYRQYEELEDAAYAHPLYRVYRSLQQPGRFLVVPTRYVITRYAAGDAARAYRPVILVYSTIDAEQPDRNRVFFDATVQPDLPPDVRRALLARLSAVAERPVIEYPTEIPSDVEYAWTVDGRVNVTPAVREAPDSFQVTLTTDIAGTLLLRGMLETGGIRGGVTFTLPDGSELQSELLLELASITGPWPQGPVSVTPTAGGVELRNNAERAMTVSELRLYANAADPGTSVPVGAELQPKERKAVALASPAAEVVPVAAPSGSGAATLEEVRSFVEDIETNVIVIDLVNLANHDLRDFTVKARIKGVVGTRAVPLAAPSNGAAGAGRVGEVKFTLPLTTFLEKHLLQLQVAKVALDGRKKTTPWIDWDLESRGNVVSIEWEMIH